MTRRILVVSYEHPPCPGMGGARWAAMSRHLRDLGYSVTVVASSAWGTLPDDETAAVVRVGDLRASPLLRRILARGELRIEGYSDLERPPTALLTHVLVPELTVLTWLPALLHRVRCLLHRADYDCLVTTSPPESVHLLGVLLGRRRPAWLADLRDGWIFEPWRPRFPTAAQRLLDVRLERRVVRSADVVVGATRPIADDLERRLGSHAAWVPNGWDPTADSGPPRAPVLGVDLVYTGTLSGSWGRSPEPLLRALARLRREDGAAPLRLVHAGRLTAEERELIDRTGATDLVEHLGTLDRARTRELQRSARALLLITSRNASEATGKLFEYLSAGRPIVALAEDNEAARIVAETGTGITVAPDDVDAIVAGLRSVVSGELERTYAPHGLEQYTYPGPAQTIAQLVEEAIARRARRS